MEKLGLGNGSKDFADDVKLIFVQNIGMKQKWKTNCFNKGWQVMHSKTRPESIDELILLRTSVKDQEIEIIRLEKEVERLNLLFEMLFDKKPSEFPPCSVSTGNI